ncbi:unnamed protein product [Psylliodes chrysocephalus]|uniref:Regulatory protein zeste n=1 Tax=Psylliodes chrysocephalus TaxID=3402493 RepID=A0A9P0CSX2_9CUCU|nr:unnamed protein product [Psylliodes chrysocephala]
MAFKVTPAHWEVLLNFMEAHPDFARGQISGPNAKDIMKKLWATCAKNLNSVGGGARKVYKWQKTWTDFKYNPKKKASALMLKQTATGGGPPNMTPLSEVEIKFLGILGQTFYEGLIESEIILQNSPEPMSLNTPNEEIDTNLIGECSKGGAVKECFKTGTIQRTPIKRFSDHDYVKLPHGTRPKKMKTTETDVLYKETISELKEIRSTLQEVNINLQGVHCALNRIADIMEKRSKSKIYV